MPKPLIEVRSRRLVKYAFPVIRSVIDQLGAPREIKKVAPQQSGPLLVTLAMDISCDCMRDICSHLEVSSEQAYLPPESLVPDMFEGLPTQTGGAGQILLNHNARWWTEFAKRCEAKFHNLALSTGPLRILLRSPIANTAANKMAEGKITYDHAWLEIARKPQAFFSAKWPQVHGLNRLDQSAIRKWRSILMQEDTKQKNWIHSKAGAFHPSTSSYWDDGVKRIERFTAGRASNELYYCLSQGVSGWVPFHIQASSANNWQTWLEKARSGNPPYWCVE